MSRLVCQPCNCGTSPKHRCIRRLVTTREAWCFFDKKSLPAPRVRRRRVPATLESEGKIMSLRSARATAGIVLAVLLGQLYSGARGYAQQSTGQLLISSGFNPIAATTPEMVNRLMSFPPNQFQLRQKGGRPYYVYADPSGC